MIHERDIALALRGVAELFERDGTWCRSAFAQDAEGRSVRYYDSRAVRFCAVGGVRRVCLQLVGVGAEVYTQSMGAGTDACTQLVGACLLRLGQ